VLDRGGGLIVRREVVRVGNPEQKKKRWRLVERWNRVWRDRHGVSPPGLRTYPVCFEHRFTGKPPGLAFRSYARVPPPNRPSAKNNFDYQRPCVAPARRSGHASRLEGRFC